MYAGILRHASTGGELRQSESRSRRILKDALAGNAAGGHVIDGAGVGKAERAGHAWKLLRMGSSVIKRLDPYVSDPACAEQPRRRSPDWGREGHVRSLGRAESWAWEGDSSPETAWAIKNIPCPLIPNPPTLTVVAATTGLKPFTLWVVLWACRKENVQEQEKQYVCCHRTRNLKVVIALRRELKAQRTTSNNG